MESTFRAGDASGGNPPGPTVAAGPALRPRITDFGLAKQTEGDSGLTRTNAIMGTPNIQWVNVSRNQLTFETLS